MALTVKRLRLQDAVARRCKFCFLYKRPGQRVIINKRGDMLVRPTFIELTLNQTPLTTSVHDMRPTLCSIFISLAFTPLLHHPDSACNAMPGTLKVPNQPLHHLKRPRALMWQAKREDSYGSHVEGEPVFAALPALLPGCTCRDLQSSDQQEETPRGTSLLHHKKMEISPRKLLTHWQLS